MISPETCWKERSGRSLSGIVACDWPVLTISSAVSCNTSKSSALSSYPRKFSVWSTMSMISSLAATSLAVSARGFNFGEFTLFLPSIVDALGCSILNIPSFDVLSTVGPSFSWYKVAAFAKIPSKLSFPKHSSRLSTDGCEFSTLLLFCGKGFLLPFRFDFDRLVGVREKLNAPQLDNDTLPPRLDDSPLSRSRPGCSGTSNDESDSF
mmetsp:Transcript_36244/g.87319  ORF Transcript_36244/g.87319 Transcript_36244/m.87319 type:complete len:208 (-) Transcript_36244:1899-2522(-)